MGPGKPALLALFLVGSPLCAGDGLDAAFMVWADQHKAHPAVLVAIDEDGETLAQAGSANPDTPMPVASVSKTIAGQCVMHLVRQDRLSLDLRIGDVLDWPAPQGDVTVAELLTHTSGFGPDATQRDIFGRSLTRPEKIARLIAEIPAREMREDGSATYYYNNENYLVLGAVMAGVLGEDALAWCRRSTPALAGLKSLRRSSVAPALDLAGGLEVSARDLAAFFQDLAVDQGWPRQPIGGNNAYGPGIIVQAAQNGENLFHLGGICVALGPKFGAFAARLSNGKSVAVLYSTCPDEAALGQLNALVLEHLGSGSG